MTHRFFADETWSGKPGLEEIPPPPWTDTLQAELRYTYDILEQALPMIEAEGLRFVFTKEAYRVPVYGRDVVVVMLQEERCKVPVYGRQVRAVIRNLLSRPYIGFRPHLPVTKLEAVLSFEYARDWYTHLRSRFYEARSDRNLAPAVRREGKTIRVPLGYHSQVEVPQVPMAERPLDLFFAGQVRYTIPPGSYQHFTSTSKCEARLQLWAELETLKQQSEWNMDLGDIRANQRHELAHIYDTYSEKMVRTRICLAPRGSVADSFRSFEGLRAGCLVVANPLPRDEYMYPDAPILYINHWREIEGILRKYARNVDLLEEWRARSLAWWHDHLRPEVIAPMVARELNEAGRTLLQ